MEQQRQYVGIDLHRRRSVIVRRNQAGETLATVRIDNDPMALSAEVAKAGALGAPVPTAPREIGPQRVPNNGSHRSKVPVEVRQLEQLRGRDIGQTPPETTLEPGPTFVGTDATSRCTPVRCSVPPAVHPCGIVSWHVRQPRQPAAAVRQDLALPLHPQGRRGDRGGRVHHRRGRHRPSAGPVHRNGGASHRRALRRRVLALRGRGRRAPLTTSGEVHGQRRGSHHLVAPGAPDAARQCRVGGGAPRGAPVSAPIARPRLPPGSVSAGRNTWRSWAAKAARRQPRRSPRSRQRMPASRRQ